ncbi:hypothetical protein BC829DRAFT_387114 [Chytridium lagenaria]|nr:hypothetical protein BC829DRAFT_387114 [Chytridium lagenaria]
MSCRDENCQIASGRIAEPETIVVGGGEWVGVRSSVSACSWEGDVEEIGRLTELSAFSP